jgi:ribonuclease VapC
MVIDTSALLALLQNEPGAPALRKVLAADNVRLISAMSVLEATCVLVARRGPRSIPELELFLAEFLFEIVPFDPAQLLLAQRAWVRFGGGRHRAPLNFGDCAPYALSKSSGEPLLFVGNDFSRTDITAVLH